MTSRLIGSILCDQARVVATKVAQPAAATGYVTAISRRNAALTPERANSLWCAQLAYTSKGTPTTRTSALYGIGTSTAATTTGVVRNRLMRLPSRLERSKAASCG